MKPRNRMAVGMFLLVLAAGAASVTLFILEGSQVAVFAQIGIIPVLIIVGYLWVNRTVRSTGTSRGEFERRKARQVGELFSDIWQLAQQIERAYPNGISKAEWDRVERQMNDLEDSGILFDQSAGTFKVDVQALDNLEGINRLETDVEQLSRWLPSQFSKNVERRVAEVNSAVSRLDMVVEEITTVEPSSVPPTRRTDDGSSTSWQEVGNVLDECYEKADVVVEEACGTVREAARSTEDVTDTQIEAKLSDARQVMNAREYDQAVRNVIDARNMIERDATGSFEEQQEAVQRLLEVAASKPFDQYLGPSQSRTIEEYQSNLNSLGDTLEIAELRRLGDQARSTCVEITDKLEAELNRAVEQLETADTPEGWYERPAAVDTDFVRALREEQSLTAFRSEFERAVDELLSALDAVASKASVIKGYDRIESEIADTIRAQGIVTGADIPVSEQEEQFLGLYYRTHMDEIEFDPDTPKLTAVEGGEFYTVTVMAAFPEGGPERELIIRLKGADTRQKRCYTPLVAETTFDDLPYGEYTVTVEPGEDSYSSVEREILLDEQMTLEIDLERVSLREQLCQDVNIDTEKILDDFSARFMTRFDDQGYLSTQMSFPIDDEYVPCLIAVWAERKGYDTSQSDGSIIIYDSERIRKEIENIVMYNLEAGESKTFDQLRNNFLSAPISDTTITTIINDSSEREGLTVDGDRLVKQEES